MKVVILVHLFPPKWLAGTEIATYNMAKYLAGRGNEIHVITSQDTGLPKQSIEQGFSIHRVKVIKKRVLLPLIYALTSLFLIKRLAPDIVQCQDITTGIAALLTKRLFRNRYIVRCQGADVYSSWLFKKSVSSMVLKNADAVIALTKDMQSRVHSMSGKDCLIIPNGTDLERTQHLPGDRLPLRSGNTILFVGRLHPVKGVVYLIEAMKIIASRNDKAKLLIVGDGSERKALHHLIQKKGLHKRVNLVGEVTNEEVLEYMATSDIFVLPSLSEGFPTTILEAMASGLPIVTSRVTGLPEIIKDGENGFLAQPKNPQQIADKLQLLLDNKELRGKISEANTETVKRYSWENVTKNLEQVYSSILHH